MQFTLNGEFVTNVQLIANDYSINCDNCGENYAHHTGFECINPVLIAPWKTAKTQKARGVLYLLQHLVPTGLYNSIPAIQFVNNAQLKDIACDRFPIPVSFLGKFARPCPLKPRHGFVDSRVIATRKEVVKLAKETLAADKDAELLICSLIEADYSAVMTPDSITYGSGNSGATSGSGDNITIPIPHWANNKDFWRSQDYFHIEGTPYIEVLFIPHTTRGVLCQLRSGPALPHSLDFIPRAMTVQRILRAEGDLLSWEKKIQSVKNDLGLIVNHVGGSLSSHYAVHCILHDIPIMTTRAPVCGERLEAITDDQAVPVDYSRLATWVASMMRDLPIIYNFFLADLLKPTTMSATLCATSAMATVGIAYLHAQSLWDGRDELLKLRAFGIVATLGCLYATLIGEARHCNSLQLAKIWGDVDSALMLADGKVGKRQRHNVFGQAMRLTLPQLAALYDKLYRTFSDEPWSDGYGGLAWLNCTQATQSFYCAAAQLVDAPCSANYVELITHWNRAINMVHNGGSPISKMNLDSVVEATLNNPARAFLSKTTASILYKLPKQPVAPPIVESDITHGATIHTSSKVGTFSLPITVDIYTYPGRSPAPPTLCASLVFVAQDESKFITVLEFTLGTGSDIPRALINHFMQNTNNGRPYPIIDQPAEVRVTITKDHIITARVWACILGVSFEKELPVTHAKQAWLMQKFGIRTMLPKEKKTILYTEEQRSSVRDRYIKRMSEEISGTTTITSAATITTDTFSKSIFINFNSAGCSLQPQKVQSLENELSNTQMMPTLPEPNDAYIYDNSGPQTESLEEESYEEEIETLHYIPNDDDSKEYIQ